MTTAHPCIVAGIDVGGHRKGFHAVALQDGVYLSQIHSMEVMTIVDWCRQIQAKIIGIDAPCRWSENGLARPAERQLMATGIQCFASPTREQAVSHPRNYYGWMLNGEQLYQAFASSHPIYTDHSLHPVQHCCFETFPHAITCAFSGHIVMAKDKYYQRSALLSQLGIYLPQPAGIDFIDAALCAVAAHFFALGKPYKEYGEPLRGFILVPDYQNYSN